VIDVALLGCAHPHVPDVLGVLASEPQLRLVAAWDADPSAIPVAISGAAVSRAETAISRAQAVIICAPTDERPGLCVRAARAGRPLLVEKPIARSAADARTVAREVERSRTPAACTLFLRELPAFRRLSEVLRERLLGRLASVSATFSHPGAVDGWFDGPVAWMRDPARAGVGGFGDLAIHLVDALAALPSDEPPTLAAVALDRPAGRRGDVGGAAVGTWAGVPLVVRAGWAAPAPRCCARAFWSCRAGAVSPSAGSARRPTPRTRCASSSCGCGRGGCRGTGWPGRCGRRRCWRRRSPCCDGRADGRQLRH
jgi:predicted dehydrogenase